MIQKFSQGPAMHPFLVEPANQKRADDLVIDCLLGKDGPGKNNGVAFHILHIADDFQYVIRAREVLYGSPIDTVERNGCGTRDESLELGRFSGQCCVGRPGISFT